MIDASLQQHFDACGYDRPALAALLRQAAAIRDIAPAVVEDLAAVCRAEATTFAPGDPYLTAYQEGMRSAYLHLMELIRLAESGLTIRETDDGRTEFTNHPGGGSGRGAHDAPDDDAGAIGGGVILADWDYPDADDDGFE